MKRAGVRSRKTIILCVIFASHVLPLLPSTNAAAGDNKWSTVRTRLPECAPTRDLNMQIDEVKL